MNSLLETPLGVALAVTQTKDWQLKKMPKTKRTVRTTNASGYIGVYVSANGKRYHANIRTAGKTIGLGTHDTGKQAAKAFDAAAIKLGRSLEKLNFPGKVPPGYTPANNGQRSNNTSGFRGVTKTKNGWMAQIHIQGKQKHLGYFSTRKQAVIAHDVAAINFGGPPSKLNFPNESKQQVSSSSGSSGSSGFRGVYQKKSRFKHGEHVRGRFMAQIRVDGKCKYIGMFGTSKEAARAHDQAILQYNLPVSKLNFPPTTTTTTQNKTEKSSRNKPTKVYEMKIEFV